MEDSPQTVLSFFGLREQPFAATADPSFFCAVREHKECLFRLWNTIDECHGIAVVLGHYGTGKTTLLRKLLTGMRAKPDVYNTAVLASPIPSWTSFSLLEAIVGQFQVRPEKRSFVSYMEALYRYLLAHRERITTLIIDDAQNLNKRGQLELLRLAQNLETPQHKLLNLVFFAQLEWMSVLRAAPNFEQRISLSYTLKPLSIQETERLIGFRLRKAGAGPQGPVFDDVALKIIQAYAEGSPRVTVTLCRNALMLAAQVDTRRIGQAIMLHTIQKTTLPDPEKNARVSALLRTEGTRTAPRSGPPTLFAGTAVSPQAERGRQAANRMLLNAARKRATGLDDA